MNTRDIVLPDEIRRENLVRTLETLLSGDAQNVIVYGQEGIGKSTLLRHFQELHRSHCFGLWISGASRWAYDPDQVAADLYSQVESHLSAQESELDSVDMVQLGRLFIRLRRRAERNEQIYYFVVDGLDDIPSEDETSKRQILDLLPFGSDPRFRFLISATQPTDVPLDAATARHTKEFLIPYFSHEDIQHFLKGYTLSDADFADVTRITKGIPGRLAVLRRLLSSVTEPSELLSSLPDKAPELFRIEWNGVRRDDRVQVIPLAVLAFESRPFTSGELSELTGVAVEVLVNQFEQLPFISHDASSRWQFQTDADRRFAARELAYLRQEVNELFIKQLLQHPDSDAALLDLPGYFTSANRLKDLVDYLSPTRFAKLFETAPTLSVVSKQADRGIAAARELGRDGDLVRFSIQRSTILEIATASTTVAEVRALSAVGDYDTAMALAEATSRTELKFRLYAAISRSQKEAGMSLEPAILARLRDLFALLDPQALAEDRVSTAVDLLHTLPDLAVELVRVGAPGQEDENSMDWGLARLVIQSQLQNDAGVAKRAEKLHEQIKDPGVRRLSAAATMLLGTLTAEEALQHARSLESTSDQLFVLQHWIVSNRSSQNVVIVLGEALKLALKATDYAVNASVYREMAVCLPYVENTQEAQYYLELFDAQKAVLEKIGPEEDYFRLQLILARAQWMRDQDAAKARLMGIYEEAEKIADPVVRTSILARLSSVIHRVSDRGALDETLDAFVEHELTGGTQALLRYSAEHDEVLRGVIQALASTRPEFVLKSIQDVNTEWRRDLCYQEFIATAASVPISEMPVQHIVRAFQLIVNPEIFDNAVEDLSTALRRLRLAAGDMEAISPLIQLISQARSAVVRSITGALTVSWLADAGMDAASETSTLLGAIDSAWDALDPSYSKMDVAAEIIGALGRTFSEHAEKYVLGFKQLKATLPFTDAEAAHAGVLGLLLAIRAYAGMVRHKLATDRDEQRLLWAIDQLGNVRDQVALLSTLAIRSFYAGAQDRCEAVVRERLVELLHTLQPLDPTGRAEVIVEAAPALHLGAPGIAASFVSSLEPLARDTALFNTAWVLLTKVPSGDNYDDPSRSGYNINFEEANQVLGLMRAMELDSNIYSLLVALVDSADPQASAQRFNRSQRADLIRQMDELAKAKFPNTRFITHPGYLVAARAQINRLRERATATPPENFGIEARGIENVSDRAYVLAIVALTARDHRDRERLLTEASSMLDTIPMLSDQIDRYILFSSMVAHKDAAKSKAFLRHAQMLLLRGVGHSADAQRRSLISTAYRLDPDFAASLASATDDDPAQRKVERQLRLYQLADSLTATKREAEINRKGRDIDWSKAAWIKLGQLHAGRAGIVPPDRALPILEYAAPQPITLAYPIFAWFIENAVRRMAHGSADVRSYVLPLFEACLHGAELAIHTSARYAKRPSYRVDITQASPSSSRDAELIGDGHRPEAIEMLRHWLAEQVERELFIVDPYFGVDSLDLLKLIRDADKEWEVTVATGPKPLEKLPHPIDESLRDAWRRYSSDDPPYTRLIFARTRTTKKFPVHDRWWLTASSGVQIGTSFNGLGARLSTVRILSREEAGRAMEELHPYFHQLRISFEGERLDYTVVTL